MDSKNILTEEEIREAMSRGLTKREIDRAVEIGCLKAYARALVDAVDKLDGEASMPYLLAKRLARATDELRVALGGESRLVS